MKKTFLYAVITYSLFMAGLIFHFWIPQSTLGRIIVVITGLVSSIVLFQFSSYSFFGYNWREIKAIGLTGTENLNKIYSLYFGVPFAIISLTGIFAVLEWASPLLLYFFAVLSCAFSIGAAFKLHLAGAFSDRQMKVIRKYLILLIGVIVLFGVVIALNWEEFEVVISPAAEPRRRLRY